MQTMFSNTKQFYEHFQCIFIPSKYAKYDTFLPHLTRVLLFSILSFIFTEVFKESTHFCVSLFCGSILRFKFSHPFGCCFYVLLASGILNPLASLISFPYQRIHSHTRFEFDKSVKYAELCLTWELRNEIFNVHYSERCLL